LDNAVAVAAAAAALERWGSASEAAPSVVASADGAADVVLTNTLFAAVEAGAGAGKVSIQNRGASRILVERRVEGAPQAGSFAATTNGIAVARRYFSPDGEPLDPEDGSIRRGDTVFAEISVMPFPDAGATLESVVIDELLPAGLEPQIGAEAPQRKGGAPALNTIHREVRDDRITVFAGEFSGERVLRYAAQAVSDGSFALPPVQAGEMYRPGITGTAAPGRLVISE
ncbi:MAG: hypothetical protein IJS46_02740, partial [Kiritimatiellae bacterium]|nr:hypothetical protein [Kiritimatiellia bacterium]